MIEAVRRLLRVNVACSAVSIAALCLLGSWYGRGVCTRLGGAACGVTLRPPARGRISTAVPPAEDRLFGAPLARLRLDDASVHFEPAAYRRHYSDLAQMTDDAQAAHYIANGIAECRVARRLRVVATYEAAAGRDLTVLYGGLCNQLYSHVDMLAVLTLMGAEVVLPDAVHRGGHGFNDSFFDNEIQPIRAPLDSLFDADHLVEWAAAAGAVLHTAAPLVEETISVVVSGQMISPYRQETMGFIVDVISRAVLDAAGNWLSANPGRDPAASLPVVMLQLQPPNLMFALRTDTSHTELIEEISRNLRPAPAIRRAAEDIVARLTAGGKVFNGVHLRVEGDANFRTFTEGSTQGLLALYVELMKAHNISAPTPLYVASGLLTYMEADDFQSSIVAELTTGGVCGPVVVKEQLLSRSQMEGLMSEALALVDLLVLVHAERFAGWFMSSFSWVVQEYRCLQGVSTASTTMVRPHGHGLLDYFLMAALLSNHTRTCPE